MLFLYELHVYVSMLFTPFHHISMFMFQRFLHYFIILLYVYVSIFSYYFTVHISSCALCFHTTHTISPYILYVYVSIFSYYFTVHINRARYVSILLILFHHTVCMFMFPCFLHLFAIFLCLCFDAFYTISPYCLICVMFPCFCTISPCILIVRVMFPYYSHYFTTYPVTCSYIHVFAYEL